MENENSIFSGYLSRSNLWKLYASTIVLSLSFSMFCSRADCYFFLCWRKNSVYRVLTRSLELSELGGMVTLSGRASRNIINSIHIVFFYVFFNIHKFIACEKFMFSLFPPLAMQHRLRGASLCLGGVVCCAHKNIFSLRTCLSDRYLHEIYRIFIVLCICVVCLPKTFHKMPTEKLSRSLIFSIFFLFSPQFPPRRTAPLLFASKIRNSSVCGGFARVRGGNMCSYNVYIWYEKFSSRSYHTKTKHSSHSRVVGVSLAEQTIVELSTPNNSNSTSPPPSTWLWYGICLKIYNNN